MCLCMIRCVQPGRLFTSDARKQRNLRQFMLSLPLFFLLFLFLLIWSKAYLKFTDFTKFYNP